VARRERVCPGGGGVEAEEELAARVEGEAQAAEDLEDDWGEARGAVIVWGKG
jgi:hypothetical protein